MGLYLVPATRENLQQTIERELPSSLADMIEPALRASLYRQAGIEGLRCWAMTVTNRPAFERMTPGDDVLLSEKGTGRFTHYGQVTGKTENRALGDRIWPYVGERPWELIYFLRNIRLISVPKTELVVELGYAPNDAVAGARWVEDRRVSAFVERYGKITDWLRVEAEPAEVPPAISTPEPPDADFTAGDLLSPAKRRQGHEIFARRVKAAYGHACAICGISETRFLVAGHIVGWAQDRSNRLNPANGLCLCVLHDRAFEAGYITLDDELRVLVSPKVLPTSPLGTQLHTLAGKPLRRPSSSAPRPEFLARHRARLIR